MSIGMINEQEQILTRVRESGSQVYLQKSGVVAYSNDRIVRQ